MLAKKILLGLLLLAILVVVLYSALQRTTWNVPEEAKKLQNPVPPSPEALRAGASLYRNYCAECHGDSGRGDGSEGKKYDPAPTNLADAPHMNATSDGELFYKISQGLKPMPAFKKKLADRQRWQLVLFIRSLADSARTAH